MAKTIKKNIHALATNLEKIDQAYSDYARNVNFTYTELQIINLINDIPGCTQKMICDASLLPKQTVNNILKKLIENKIVNLDNSTHKNKTISFTEIGQAYANKLLTPIREAEVKAMSSLSSEERDTLEKLLTKYTESFASYINIDKEEIK
ncbi:MAG: MarR family winged helix-turn-helix transcriptional regulator [Erysipelothrix sp.]